MFVFPFKLLVHKLFPIKPECPKKLWCTLIPILCALCYCYCNKEKYPWQTQQRSERSINIEQVMMPRPPTSSAELSAPVVLEVTLPPDQDTMAPSAPPPPYEEPPPYQSYSEHFSWGIRLSQSLYRNRSIISIKSWSKFRNFTQPSGTRDNLNKEQCEICSNF